MKIKGGRLGSRAWATRSGWQFHGSSMAVPWSSGGGRGGSVAVSGQGGGVPVPWQFRGSSVEFQEGEFQFRGSSVAVPWSSMRGHERSKSTSKLKLCHALQTNFTTATLMQVQQVGLS